MTVREFSMGVILLLLMVEEVLYHQTKEVEVEEEDCTAHIYAPNSLLGSYKKSHKIDLDRFLLHRDSSCSDLHLHLQVCSCNQHMVRTT